MLIYFCELKWLKLLVEVDDRKLLRVQRFVVVYKDT
jgi:hypothetical protein